MGALPGPSDPFSGREVRPLVVRFLPLPQEHAGCRAVSFGSEDAPASATLRATSDRDLQAAPGLFLQGSGASASLVSPDSLALKRLDVKHGQVEPWMVPLRACMEVATGTRTVGSLIPRCRL